MASNKGEIICKNIKGAFKVETEIGSIKINDAVGNIYAKTLKGDIFANIIMAKDSLNLISTAGNIKLDMPLNKGMDFNFNAQKIASEKLNNFNGTSDINLLNGKLNGGGTKVNVNAALGNIKLNTL